MNIVGIVMSCLCCILTFYIGQRSNHRQAKLYMRDEFKRHIDIIFTPDRDGNHVCNYNFNVLHKDILWFKSIKTYKLGMSSLTDNEYMDFLCKLEELDNFDHTANPNALYRDEDKEKAFEVYKKALVVYDNMNNELNK